MSRIITFTFILSFFIVQIGKSQCLPGAVNPAIWGTPDDFALGFTADADITDEDTLVVIQGEDTTVTLQYLLPKKQAITSPITGTAVVTSVSIQGVSGMPTGLNWTLDAAATANGNSYNPQSNRFGSVTICGTTFSSPGVKTLTVSAIGCGELSGISDCAGQNFPLYIEVLPGQGGNSAFTISPPVGCNNIDVDFEAIFQSPDPVLFPVDFEWDLGDGTISTGTTVTGHNYSTPGVYPVKLDVILNEFYISSASVICSGGWYPDIEELTALQAPDPYLNILGTITSTGSGTSESWSGLDITLNSTTITAQAFDEDNGGIFGSADDDLGSGSTTIIPSAGGTYGITTANAIINVTVSKRISETLTFWDTVRVFNPSVATILSTNGTSFCGNDSTILDVGTGYESVQWYSDSSEIIGATNQTLIVNESGAYYAVILEAGNICEGYSDTITINVNSVSTPVIMATANGLGVENLDAYEVQWYSNGIPIPGATADELTDLSSGNPFTVTFTNTDSCMATSAPFVGCLPGMATAPNGTDVDGTVAKTFVATGFSFNAQTQIAWSVTPVANGLITSVADVDSINSENIYLGDSNTIDLQLNCSALQGPGTYYLTPFLIEATELPEFPFPYSDSTCIPSMGLGISFNCDNPQWEIGNASVIDPSGTPIDLLSLSPVQISYPIAPGLVCSALGGTIADINLFDIAPNSNPNGTWSISVQNSGSGTMEITIPAFQIGLNASDCSDITDDMIFDYGPYNINIPAGGTENISITVPPLPTNFPSIAESCSAFGEPLEIEISNCVSAIQDVISIDNINLYPNPNNGMFTLNFEVLERNNVEVSIVDITGRTVLNRNYANVYGNFNERFDLKNNLNNGFYFMEIKVGNYKTQKKFIIN